MKRRAVAVAILIVIQLCGCGLVDSYADKVSNQVTAGLNSQDTEISDNSESIKRSNSNNDITDKNEKYLFTDENKEISDVSASSVETSSAVSRDIKSYINKPDMVMIDEPLREYVDERSEKQKAFDEIDMEVEEKNYQLGYPDAVDLVDEVVVDERYINEEVVIYISYTVGESIPKEATLTTPSGEQYAPCWKNDDRSSGLVYWRVKNPDPGEYKIQLSANAKYGTYMSDVLDTFMFSEMYIERTEPYAHPAD